MSGAAVPKFLVLDEFLPEALLGELDKYVAGDADMEFSEIAASPANTYSAPRRRWVSPHGLGTLDPAFKAAVMARFGELCLGTGVAPFEVADVEIEVCAHRDGHFFSRHIDTDIRDGRTDRKTDRMISAVYYFPKEPRAFSGGELTVYSFAGQARSEPIQPRRNRLVAFASFVLHEVSPIAIADDCFENARFSINCWLHRARR